MARCRSWISRGKDYLTIREYVQLTGYILRRQGKFEEGLHALQQAASLDPRNTSLLQQICVSYSGLEAVCEGGGNV